MSEISLIKNAIRALPFFLLSLLISISCIYSLKFLSITMPLLALITLRFRGGFKNMNFQMPIPFFFLLPILLWSGAGSIWAIDATASLRVFIATSITYLFSILFILTCSSANNALVDKAFKLMWATMLFLFFLVSLQQVLDLIEIQIISPKKSYKYLMIKPTGQILGLIAFVSTAFLWVKKYKIFAIFNFFTIGLLIYCTRCDTAKGASIIALLAFMFSYAAPIISTRIAIVFSYTFIILSPAIFTYIIPPSFLSQSEALSQVINRSLFARILAWEFYAKKFFLNPIWGWGAESSRYLPDNASLAPGYQKLIHPHNSSIQTYAELGFVGGLLFALFFASLFWVIHKKIKDRLSVAVCNATFTFGFITAEVTHNVWRNYWLSFATMVAGLCILFIKAREAQLREVNDHSKLSPTPSTESVQQLSYQS